MYHRSCRERTVKHSGHARCQRGIGIAERPVQINNERHFGYGAVASHEIVGVVDIFAVVGEIHKCSRPAFRSKLLNHTVHKGVGVAYRVVVGRNYICRCVGEPGLVDGIFDVRAGKSCKTGRISVAEPDMRAHEMHRHKYRSVATGRQRAMEPRHHSLVVPRHYEIL